MIKDQKDKTMMEDFLLSNWMGFNISLISFNNFNYSKYNLNQFMSVINIFKDNLGVLTIEKAGLLINNPDLKLALRNSYHEMSEHIGQLIRIVNSISNQDINYDLSNLKQNLETNLKLWQKKINNLDMIEKNINWFNLPLTDVFPPQ